MRARISLLRLLIMVLLTAVLIELTLYNKNNVVAQEVSPPMAIDLDTVEWGPPGGGNGTPLGLRTARMGVDPVSGGGAFFAMVSAGPQLPTHLPPNDEDVGGGKGGGSQMRGGT